MMIRRRQCLGGLFSLPVVSLGLPRQSLAQAPASLASLARAKNMFFGAAITLEKIEGGNTLQDLYDTQCDVWVPEGDMQWINLEPEFGKRNYDVTRQMINVAKLRGKKMRGHSLLWHELTPPWLANYPNNLTTWQNVVEPHLVATSQEFADNFFSWDVLNEPLDTDDGLDLGLRNTPYLQMRGPQYIDQVFEISRAFAPNVTRYLNEHSLTHDEYWHEERRGAFLKLLDHLIAKNVPVQGIGIQTHIGANLDFDAEIYRRFLQEIADRGLEITLTELDVNEGDVGLQSLKERQQRVADRTYEVLEVAFDQPAVKGLVCWALSDRHNWLRRVLDLHENNGMPFDENYRPTPMFEAIARAFKGAKVRVEI